MSFFKEGESHPEERYPLWPATDAERRSPAGRQIAVYEELLREIGPSRDPEETAQTAQTLTEIIDTGFGVGLTRLEEIQKKHS